MRCQGRPEDGRCPDNRNDSTVHNTVGDLFLCHACEDVRSWPSVAKAAKSGAKSGASSSLSTATKRNGPATRSTTNVERFQAKPAVNSNKPMNVNCVVCREEVDSRHLSCDICHDCFHANCWDTFERLITIVGEAGWVCPGCRNDNSNRLQSIRATLTRATEQIADMQIVINTLKSEIDGLKAGTYTAMSPPPPPFHSALATVPTGICDGAVPDAGEAVKVEVHKTLTDLSRRKKNVVITGLPEPVGDQSDDTLFSQFCETHLTTKPSLSYLGCRRLGRQPDTYGRPRRLLVHLNTEACAEELLKAAKQLRNCSEPYARSIYINPDFDPVSAKLAYEKRVRRRQQQQQQQPDQQHIVNRVFTCTVSSSTSPPTALSDPQGTNSHSCSNSDTTPSFRNSSPV